ncbi:hypothetical protein F3Y22_tig00111303pilonHSYRG00111 [Hibiscus syriacus]|uniref:Uncharacterized protein n=1 Tax=Hibiscus syriacus TaxID=106335 RepID=A0A6A2YR28_HIBSY|nr:hypothetical protein F3Y22_tig00111303pilonHSYRG00111 [Hibiscus syriacus]
MSSRKGCLRRIHAKCIQYWGYNDLDDLKRTVIRIQAVLLDAKERSVTSNVVKVWLHELKDALYDAEDLFDDVHTEALRKDLMSGNKLIKEVRVFFSSSNQFAYGRKMGGKIRAIKARFAPIQSQTKIAFEQRSADSTNPAFLEVGKQIAKKCGGVPLVTRTIARKLTSLQTLSLFVVDNRDSHGGDAADLKDDKERSPEDLQPHSNLQELHVIGWKGDTKFPSWLSLLTSLVYIRIFSSRKFKHLPSFATLPHLQQLRIEKLSEVEYMDYSDPSGGQGESESFSNRLDCPLTSMPLYPSLDEVLTLINTSSRPLKQTIQMNIISTTPSTSSLPLSKLKSFALENIEEMDTNMLDECLQNMTSLKQWRSVSWLWLKSLSGCLQQLTGLKRLTIHDCKELDLEGMQWELLKNLSHLEINYFPQMVDSSPSPFNIFMSLMEDIHSSKADAMKSTCLFAPGSKIYSEFVTEAKALCIPLKLHFIPNKFIPEGKLTRLSYDVPKVMRT